MISKCLENGANHFVSKNDDFQVLLSTIESYLAGIKETKKRINPLITKH